jgi:plasmid maintenance system killer protein
VELSFKTNKLEKQLTNPKELLKTFGERARKVNQRITELRGAETLAIMRTIPAARCHELSGNLNGELGVDVSVNFRLVFQPNHDPTPRKEDGGLLWDEVTKIQINGIEDYH